VRTFLRHSVEEHFDVKSYENVRRYMDMFNCDDIDTMLMKRRQKFLDGSEHLAILLWTIHCAK